MKNTGWDNTPQIQLKLKAKQADQQIHLCQHTIKIFFCNKNQRELLSKTHVNMHNLQMLQVLLRSIPVLYETF